MFGFIVGVVVGLAVGWNLPQPQWAREIQKNITETCNKFFKK